jgi:transposase
MCVMTESGEITWRGKVKTDPVALARAVRRHAPNLIRVGMESGPHSTWLWHGMRREGVAVICIDARHAQGVLSMRINKSDENDAEGLTNVMRVGWFREVQVRQMSSHASSAIVVARALLVKHRQEVENQIRGLLKNFGLRVTASKGRAFGASAAALAAGEEGIRDVVQCLLDVWTKLRQQIVALTLRIQQQTKGDAICQRLMTAPGIGPITALTYRAVIDDPTRFRHSATVGAFVGLTSRRYASGEIDRNGRISCRGDRLLRSYLYEAGNVVLTRSNASNPLKVWGLKLAKRIGMKKARVAVARRLAVILHRMWVDGTEYGTPKAAA